MLGLALLERLEYVEGVKELQKVWSIFILECYFILFFSQLLLTLWFVSVGKHWDCSEPFGLSFVQPFYMWFNRGLIGQIQHPIHKFYFYYCFCWSLLPLRLLLQVMWFYFFISFALYFMFLYLIMVVTIFFWIFV